MSDRIGRRQEVPAHNPAVVAAAQEQAAGVTVFTHRENLPRLPGAGKPKLGDGMLGYMARQGMRELAQAATLQTTQVSAASYWDAIYAHDFRKENVQARDHVQSR